MRTPAIVWLSMMSACSADVGTDTFAPTGAPAHLSWPQERVFLDHATTWSARPIELLRGRVRGRHLPAEGVETLLSVQVDDEGLAMVRQLTESPRGLDSRGLRCALRARGETWIFDCDGEWIEVDVPGWRPAERHTLDAAWRAWVYTATLLERTSELYEGSGALRARTEAPEDDPVLTTVLEALEQDQPEAVSSLWALVDRTAVTASWARWAQLLALVDDRDAALALAIHRRLGPVDGCVAYPESEVVAAQYAERCFALGDLECFVRLQAQELGARRASVSSRAGVPEPGVRGLARAGIDVPRFLLGALLAFDVTRDDGSTVDIEWFSASAVVSAMSEWSGSELELALAAWVEDVALDDHNRVRATWALAQLLERRHGADVAYARVGALSLSPASRALFDGR